MPAGLDYKDYYAVLGVPKTASQAEIKKAFRKLARQHHPDAKPGDTESERRFKEVNEANEVLSDPARRKQYDELGANWESISRGGGAGGAGSPFGFGGAGPAGGNVRYEFRSTGDAGEFSDFFRMFFGQDMTGAAGGAAGQPPGRGTRPTGGMAFEDILAGMGIDGRSVGDPPGRDPRRPSGTRRPPSSPWPRPTTARPAWSRSTARGSRSPSRREPTPAPGSS